MKKFFALILAALLLVSGSLADPYAPDLCFSACGALSDIGNIYPGDYFSISLFMSYDLQATLQITLWNGPDVMTITKTGPVKSRNDTPGVLYFLFSENDDWYTGHYDGDKMWRFWLDLNGGSVCLTSFETMNPLTDFEKK